MTRDGGGRRAADRRRERDAGRGAPEADPGTTPGEVPISGDGVADDDDAAPAPLRVHDDYDEVDDESRLQGAPLLSADDSVPEASGVQSASGARARAATRTLDKGPARAPAGRGVVVDEDPVDADKSFVRELKRRPPKPGQHTEARQRPEVTEVKEYKAKKARRGGALVVIGPVVVGGTQAQPAPEIGLEPGAQLAIDVYPALLGRAVAADVRLPDPCVSLRHAELAYDVEDGSFSIVDLGSGSGTLKNGVAIDGRANIDAGDVITVGRTELRFVRVEAQPKEKPPEVPPESPPLESTERLPERTSPSQRAAREHDKRVANENTLRRRQEVRRKALLVIGASAVLLTSVAVITLTYRRVFADDAPAHIRHQVSVLLAEAKAKLYEGDVDGALTRTDTVLGLEPDSQEARSLERVVRTERTARDALQLALRLGDEDRDDEALEALLRVADTSVFAKDRDRLRQTLASRALVRSLRAVENLLDAGRVDDALARAEAHVRRFPSDEGGKALLARVQAQRQRGAGAPPALQTARAAFGEGRLDDARRIAKDAGFAGFAADVDRFERSLGEGKAALVRFDGAAARGPLDDAFRLLGSLGAQPQSATFQAVQKPYADALYLTGTEKLEQGGGCGAARDLFKAARVLPGDQRLAVELSRLQALADQGLQRARGAKSQDPERAAAIAREHLCYARSGTETYEALRALGE